MDDSDDDYVDDYIPPSGSTPRQRPARRSTLKSTTGMDKASTEVMGYSWEDDYYRSWDAVQEDAGGSLAGTIAGMVELGKRNRVLHDTRPIQRGIIRNLVLVLDMSLAMSDSDMRPSRLHQTLTYAIGFVSEYFSQNPISQLAIVGMRDGLAKIISPLDGNPNLHIENIQKTKAIEPLGNPSLENALELSRSILYHVPSHCTKELLLVFGALMSSDPGDINKTVDHLIADHIRVRIIGLAAQVAVCQQICNRTNSGDSSAYSVVLNEAHFQQLIMSVTVPPKVNKQMSRNISTLVEMGFPSRVTTESPTLCSCHSHLVRQGYDCPRCGCRVCALPMACPCCKLTLILSTHLARSYHHLIPLQNFLQKSHDALSADSENLECFACQVIFDSTSHRYVCPTCSKEFCIDCDVFCHETLHNCPGCELITLNT